VRGPGLAFAADGAHRPKHIALSVTSSVAEAEPFIARETSLNQKTDVSFYNYGLISKRVWQSGG